MPFPTCPEVLGFTLPCGYLSLRNLCYQDKCGQNLAYRQPGENFRRDRRFGGDFCVVQYGCQPLRCPFGAWRFFGTIFDAHRTERVSQPRGRLAC